MPLKTLALIPARAGSKRVPGKNARLLGGKPLVQWTFDAAQSAQRVDRILLSSDDSDVATIATRAGIDVLVRPAALASDHANSVDVALHALDKEREAGRHWDVLCLLQPTSPFRAPGRVDEGLALLANSPTFEGVVGAVTPNHHPLHCLIQMADGVLSQVVAANSPISANRSQDLPAAWALTGSFYAVRTAALRAHRSFLPPACLPLNCNAPGEEIDIDWPSDFDRAEAHIASTMASV
ncbi:cytidylyltransferase domain-containing protein [Erythrobacter sp. Alg231-14]|uniref:cytidylyltransferase domain-containing protein n=1 Tax=Erythrobacter sp. Alg231-14 TaxID=1922225 RepID=UPI000D55D71E